MIVIEMICLIGLAMVARPQQHMAAQTTHPTTTTSPRRSAVTL